jgi:predicted MFS family arabinose efflux permease
MASLTGLVAVRAAAGIFAASTMPVSLALIGDVVPMQQRQRAIGTFLGISFLGQGLSMAVGGTIAALAGWRWVFIAYGFIALMAVGVLVRRGKSLPSAPIATHGSFFAPYRVLLGRWRSLRIYLVALGEGILILGLFSYLGAFLADRHGLGPLGVGLSLTAFGVASVVFGRLSGRIAGRVGRVNLIGLALLLAGGAALTLSQITSLTLEIVAIFALGAAFMLAHSSVLTIATELAAQHRGVAMSLVAFAFMGGGAFGTTMAGRVVAAQGFQSYLLAWGIGLVVLSIAARIALAGADVRVAQSAPMPVPASDVVAS